ncbi:hypothetical protein AZI85_13430 [Bdellovibrio bacteriovorus]|uniref:OmpR/PhoB-type domain-containing protein n=1 Tax=Bdellovibrio bacteriovorus TaxID=959 RepID=A0A150WC55_BDEBC|nr:winged helix-turn-helix domain-containing protein [Bdellovibrio bacteriovorus]KYG60462.1 hypothetical protein AZI85_13430 [Bdellovibrio bacteriovorus]
MTNLPHLLQLAKLQSRNGDMPEARETAAEALHTFARTEQYSFWIESARVYLQSCIELEDIATAEKVMLEALELLASGKLSESLQASAQTLIASWFLAQGKAAESQAYLDSAITKATHSRDLEVLARALLINAFQLSFNPKTFTQALQLLSKIDTLLAEIENPELSLIANNVRGYVYLESQQHDAALNTLWKNYETAKLHGYQTSISSVLGELALVARAQQQHEHYRLYAELALKGLNPQKTPRLYKRILKIYPESERNQKAHYDFEIDEKNRFVRERTKGPIDFKNQHILFDMALMFIKTPGQRYSKEDLAEKIWSQVYDPDLHDNLIYVSIKRLRTLLEPDLESPRYILRDRKGYYFNSQTHVHFKNLEEAPL